MGLRTLYLLPLLALVAACTQSDAQQEIKKLYPQKVVIGSTTHDFYYDRGRLYSVTTTRPNFYEEVTYRYYDEYFREPDHEFKDEIFEVRYKPDVGPIGWDKSDSVKYKAEMLVRYSGSALIQKEWQDVFLARNSVGDEVHHTYNQHNQLTASTHYFQHLLKGRKHIPNDPVFVSKKIRYTYDAQGELQKAAFYPPASEKPYLTIELEYDDKPGYLRNLPLEARFIPLELPYRNHNITRYTVKDANGKVRKELSYTCSYTYNRAGYPAKFTRTTLDGQEIKGYIVYKSETDKNLQRADVALN